MAYDEYGFLTTVSKCLHCGADVNNHYTHTTDCLINIKGPHSELGAFWRKGRNAAREAGKVPSVVIMPEPMREAFLMGARCAIQQIEAGQKA